MGVQEENGSFPGVEDCPDCSDDILRAFEHSNEVKKSQLHQEGTDSSTKVADDCPDNCSKDDTSRASLTNADDNDTDDDSLSELRKRNQFGENLLHLACRMDLSWDV